MPRAKLGGSTMVATRNPILASPLSESKPIRYEEGSFLPQHLLNHIAMHVGQSAF